ncbi:MAG TPA: glycosyltransferase [Chitinophagaceae bacterium]|nr:glycosyltransferase [Chitinophagaceae bacterium]
MELSIIIPTFNRSALLKKTLQSIVEQEQTGIVFEVIVVDNGSTDETPDVSQSFAGSISHFIYHYDDEPGQLTGRHRGTELATARIISFIDDDVELNPFWIRSVLELFNTSPDISIIGGPCLPKYQLYPPSWINYFRETTPYGGTACLPLSLIDLGEGNFEIDPLYVFGLNFSIRKNVLLELGGFHPDCIPAHLQKFQGDGETGLSLKARNRGVKAMYAASVFLYHQVVPERLTANHFEKWYYYSGVCQSFTDLRKKHLPLASERVSTATRSRLARVVSAPGKILKNLFPAKKDVPPKILQLQTKFNMMYHSGYRFHQDAFETDSRVRDWVLRTDYWNYKLPG